MSKIFIEKKEIKFKVQETVEETSFDMVMENMLKIRN